MRLLMATGASILVGAISLLPTSQNTFASSLAPTTLGAAGQQNAPQQQSAEAAADDLMIVDCLLPGRLRRIGRRAQGFTPRIPTRTTAIDCRIRGGEYTAFDRADYNTALAVWLPQAEGGSAEAQTYVAEIYAKGLGREPDYKKAIEWYEKAAAQGWARAQINLAAMYEQGLGVSPDYQRAQELIGSSTGIASADIEIKLESPEQSLEVLALQQQLAERNNELEALREAAEEGKAEIVQLRQRLATTLSREQELKTSIGALESDLEQRRAAASTAADPAELERLELQLREKSSELAKRVAEVATLEQQMASQNETVDAGEQKLAELQRTADSYKSQLVTLRKAQDQERKQKALEISKQGANLAPPAIELIDPQLLASRSGREVLLRSLVETRSVIGRVDAQAELLSLVVNDTSVSYDDQGLFEATVEVVAGRTPVQIVAVDKLGKPGCLLNFDLVSELREKPKADPVREVTKSIAWGEYHAHRHRQ